MTASNSSVTPMMAQYLSIKAANPGALLFYRMGDFYEMFFDDAIVASQVLDIALTKRGTHNGESVAMCGVPAHSAESYLLALIRKGFRVAIAEQMEDPAEAKKRGSKSVVKRDVTRLVTPGTLTEDALLDAKRHNYLAAWTRVREQAALVWTDISTGEFWVSSCPLERLSPEIARIRPREILINENDLEQTSPIIEDMNVALTPLSRSSFDSSASEKRLCAAFNVDFLDAFGTFNRAEVSAMGAVVDYLELTQRGQLPLLCPPVRENVGLVMQIDPSTRRNLEITSSLSGEKNGSLLSALNHTVTAGGARLLERRLSAPSCDLNIIHQRHFAVGFLQENTHLREDLRENLRRVPDINRALSRLSLERGGPRDLIAIQRGLEQALGIKQKLVTTSGLLKAMEDRLVDETSFGGLSALLERALVSEPPILVRDGGFIATGFDTDLDETRALRDESRAIIVKMQAEYVGKTGIQSLKIKHNNVLGYFVETSAKHSEKMLSPPLNKTFIHRQTTAGQIRFTTLELGALETRILNAGNHAIELEKKYFEQLRSAVLTQAGPIGMAAQVLAEIDLTAAFADLAAAEGWNKPRVDDSRAFWIKAGRHPVVEQAFHRKSEGPFIANDCTLSTENAPAIWLVTGPNMAGKSTFLRQNALIALLAQAGSFVPAQEAHIGVVSQLFSRVGASDDLTRGRSTFMVEMVETAAILNQADDRALVILDEIGRGTATYDGLSIAWATLEHLHEVNCCRALFATHYHEMTALARKLDHVENTTVVVKEWDGDIIFMYEVRKGAADRSYGVQVARLAGLPPLAVERAKIVLEKLEQGEHRSAGKTTTVIDDLPLFQGYSLNEAQVNQKTPIENTALEKRIKGLHPDDLTPRAALQLIYELKEILS